LSTRDDDIATVKMAWKLADGKPAMAYTHQRNVVPVEAATTSCATTESSVSSYDHEAYAASYKPKCAQDVFDNHFDAFGEQNIDKIMLDYTEDSILTGFDWSSGDAFEKRGVADIRAMFSGFWDAVGKWKVMEAPHKQCTDTPFKTGFLLWAAPQNGCPQCTDTFVYDDDFKIIRQTYVGGKRSD